MGISVPFIRRFLISRTGAIYICIDEYGGDVSLKMVKLY